MFSFPRIPNPEIDVRGPTPLDFIGVGSIAVVESPLFNKGATMVTLPNGERTIFVPPGKRDDFLFQMRTAAVAWTFRREMERDV